MIEADKAIDTLRPLIDPFRVAFYIADLPIYWYAIFVMLGFLTGLVVACIKAHYFYKISYDLIIYYVFIAIPVSIFGARFWSCAIGDADWSNFFDFNAGGLAIQGGVVFALIAAVIFFNIMLTKPKYHVEVYENGETYIRKPSFLLFSDVILPCILLGQAIGRWGNFFNGEIFGQQVSAESLNWLKTFMPGVFDKMQAVNQATASQLIEGAYYAPLFLYEQWANLIGFGIIYIGFDFIKGIKRGVISGSYFVVYGIIRFILEPMRFATFEFTGTYIINGLLLASGLIAIIICQFILPRFRNINIPLFFKSYYMLGYIKFLKALHIKKANEYLDLDPDLKNFGNEEKIDFHRGESNLLYYANR